MFGVVPKPSVGARAPADDRNRIRLGDAAAAGPRRAQTMLIDAGIGDKMDPKSVDIYGIDRDAQPRSRARRRGRHAGDIDIVLASHLHFDHAGGFTDVPTAATRSSRDSARARYLVRAAEWEDATHPHERNRASYLPENFVPLRDGRRRSTSCRATDDHAGRPRACEPAAIRCTTRSS